MAKHVCHRCGALTHQTILAQPFKIERNFGTFTEAYWIAAFRCDNCTEFNIGSVSHSHAGHPSTTDAAKTYMWRDDAELEWEPIRLGSRSYDHVPTHIAEAADEAHRCRSVRAFKATAILARAVVEATAKDKGVTKRNLYEMIEELHNLKLLTEIARDEAHEVRFFGNGMAHGDFVDPVTDEEADDVLALMDEVLTEVYEQRGRIDKIQKRRLAAEAAKKAAAANTQTPNP